MSELRDVFIQGVTRDGKPFRPSDWAERLAGAMSSFRPGGSAGGIGAHIGYSPLCVPRQFGPLRGVLVSAELREIEPMAWDFVMNFARDNQLVVSDPPGDGGPAPEPRHDDAQA
ncbi:MAG TPA: DUF3579 domain-containing protein [Caldimonas sp.]|nr:DUF3579 domain-containing protein [Caldimonas sp.]HEX2540630.1 DUF3579 domain-containing protein [Caldimonas sp.]